MRVLVLNPGSATLKATIVEPPRRDPGYATTVDWTPGDGSERTITDAVAAVVDTCGAHDGSSRPIDVVAYRVVHGGTAFGGPTVVDDGVIAAIESLGDLAPLHNPVAARTIRAARALLPDVSHVATFDTAFHATLPEASSRYPLPASWLVDPAIRRFGFHGLSVDWATRRAAELLGPPVLELRLVVAHLGGGCSVTAVDAGRSVETSMGMTPLEGLMMGTRAGSIDPAIILRRLEGGSTGASIRDDLDRRSGLVGVAGTSDMARLLAREEDGDAEAGLAIEMFVRRAAAAMAAAATTIPAVDAVVYTGGIGEHAGTIRDRIDRRLRWTAGAGQVEARDDDLVTRYASGPPTLTVRAREDLVIARQAVDLIRG